VKPIAQAQIGFGQVRHTRLRPRQHAFAYPTWFVRLPIRHLHQPQAMGGLAINRPAIISFHEVDHGDGRSPAEGGVLAWLDELLRAQGVNDADGEVVLHTYPRILGYVFKPVSFWYCHQANGRLRAIVAEVNNTFGERHCYLLEWPRPGAALVAHKCFHVSPFCSTDGQYQFRFVQSLRPEGERCLVRIDLGDADGPLLQTSISGQLHPLSPAWLRRALWRYPAMTLLLIWRIHWQALQLWLKRIPFHRKPAPPTSFVSH